LSFVTWDLPLSLSSPLAVPPPTGRSGLSRGALRVAMLRRRHGLAATALGAALIAAVGAFGTHFMAPDDRLGLVHFPVSCGWLSQRDFITATSLLHLFQFADAEQVYAGTFRRDTGCAMAYRGVAMSRLGNSSYRLPGKGDIAVALAALAGAFTASEAGPRERAYLMVHSSYVFLMDPQGRYVTLFTAAEVEALDEMALRLRGLVSTRELSTIEPAGGEAC
jgi:hypothetical protein